MVMADPHIFHVFASADHHSFRPFCVNLLEIHAVRADCIQEALLGVIKFDVAVSYLVDLGRVRGHVWEGVPHDIA